MDGLLALAPRDDGFRPAVILEKKVMDEVMGRKKVIMWNLGVGFRVEVDLGFGYYGRFWATLAGSVEGYGAENFERLVCDADLLIQKAEKEDEWMNGPPRGTQDDPIPVWLYANGISVNEALLSLKAPRVPDEKEDEGRDSEKAA